MGQRRRARECALQMLYQVDQTDCTTGEVFLHFWTGQTAGEDVRDFAEALVRGVIDEQRELDRLIVGAAEHWRLDRMAVVDRNVLRIAVYEMSHHPETPPAVVIDEAIEVARKYGTQESAGFINGVLDSIRQFLDRQRPGPAAGE